MSEQLPHDQRLEKLALGAALIEPDCASQVCALREDDFYEPRHKTILAAMQHLSRAGLAIDELSLVKALEAEGKANACGGYEYLIALSSETTSTAYIEQHLRELRDLSVARRIALAGRRISSEAMSARKTARDLADFAVRELIAVTHIEEQGDPVHVLEVAREVFDEFEQKDKPNRARYTTGFESLDAVLQPIEGKQLVLIGARPSAGKTSFALHLAERIAKSGAGVLFFSLETTRQKLVKRTMAQLSSVALTKINSGELSGFEMTKLANTSQTFVDLPLWIDDAYGLTLPRLHSTCRRHLAKHHKLGAVIIDYVQLLEASVRSDSREREIADISRGLKHLAKEFDIPVIALSQLNRESEKSGATNNGQLRNSGQLEQDADVILLMRRITPPTEPNVKVEVQVSKQKDGAIGPVNLAFEGPFVRFADLESDEQETPEPRQYRKAPMVQPYQEPSDE
jgi:replicative DNA helicase